LLTNEIFDHCKNILGYTRVMKRLTILISCHNRRNLTERILNQILANGTKYFSITVIVVDDFSTDGTAEMLKNFQSKNKKYILVKVINGEGDWYWSKSMSIAESYVQDEDILWLNDDVDLYPDSFLKLSKFVSSRPHSILVGQCFDPLNREPSFGGFLNESRNPLKLIRQTAYEKELIVDTFCGNFVFVPHDLRRLVGPIDEKFQHGYGDLDYGYRAKNSGVGILCMPGFVGECREDSLPNLRGRFATLKYWNSTKKCPPKSQVRFLMRHAGVTWPIWFIVPYVRIILLGEKALKPGV